MGVPTSEVGYTAAMPRREDHEVHKVMWWHWTNNISWQSVQWEQRCSKRTEDKAKLILAFRNFANAPKNEKKWRSPLSCFFRAAAFVRAKWSVPSYQQYELQHWSICEYADTYHTRTSTPLIHVHYTSQQETHTDVYPFVALARSNCEKKLRASSFLVCPSTYKQGTTPLPPNGFS